MDGIRISTAGPWAIATVDTYQCRFPKHVEMSADESFYRDRGRWLDTNSISTPERTPSDAVVADLGLSPNSSKGGGGLSMVEIIGIVLGGLVLLSILGSMTGVRGPDVDPPPKPSEPVEPWRLPHRTYPVCNGNKPVCTICGGRKMVPNPNSPDASHAEHVACYSRANPVPCSRCQGRGYIDNSWV